MSVSEAFRIAATYIALAAVGTCPTTAAARKNFAEPPLSVLANRCKRLALETVEEKADPAFRQHVATYEFSVRPRKDDDEDLIIEFEPAPPERDYWTGFSCTFDPSDWEPSLVIFE